MASRGCCEAGRDPLKRPRATGRSYAGGPELTEPLLAASAGDNGIPHAEVRLGGGVMGPDGVHPNDEGYGLIAERLRGLGYEPLGPR